MAPTVLPAPWIRLVIFTTTCGARFAVRSIACNARALRAWCDVAMRLLIARTERKREGACIKPWVP